MSETKAPPPPNVWPTLRANDAHGLIKFLTEALGFEATAVYADGDTVHHAELAWPPGGGIMLYGCNVASGADGMQFITDMSIEASYRTARRSRIRSPEVSTPRWRSGC